MSPSDHDGPLQPSSSDATSSGPATVPAARWGSSDEPQHSTAATVEHPDAAQNLPPRVSAAERWARATQSASEVAGDQHQQDQRPAMEQASSPRQIARARGAALAGAPPLTPAPAVEAAAPPNALIPVPQPGTSGLDQRKSTVPPITRPARAPFLREHQREAPATRGWRGLLARTTLHIEPGPSERAERADAAAVAAHWPGSRTIAVVNGKGGAGKTPSTALLSAGFARHGGAGVIAWENNQTRGTLGWRTQQGPHQRTLVDLLPATDYLLSPHARVSDLAAYTHHQGDDRYEVLRAAPFMLADEQRVQLADVQALHQVITKYHRLVIMDSGNDESDPMWWAMIRLTDQLVVPTTTRDDHAEAAALLLEALARRDEHCACLAAGAVVIVTQGDRSATAADLQRVATGFAGLARDVAVIPHDRAMVDGQLRWDALRPATARAWLAAGAAVARGL